MNIWLDLTLFSQSHSNNLDQCKQDPCYVDSIVPATQNVNFAFVSPTEKDVEHLYMHTLVIVDVIHVQQYGEALWLLCNPHGTGAVAVVDARMYMLLGWFRLPRVLQDVIDAMDDAFVDSVRIAQAVAIFTKLGFLRDLDELGSVFEHGQSQSLSAWLHVTNACNLHCDYCYVNKSSEHMADDTSKRAVDALIRSALSYAYEGIHLIYAGGEATLRFPQVIATHDYALQQCRNLGLKLSANLLSNGAALPVKYINQLKQRQISVMISLDGVGEQHDQQRPFVNGQGSFTFVDRTITRMVEHGLTPYINVTVTQRNLTDLPRLLAYILQRDLPFGLSYYRDNECSTHLADLQFSNEQMVIGMRAAFAYIEENLPRQSLLGALVDKARVSTPRRYACGMGRNYLAIDQRGGIAKCHADITATVTTIDVENPLRVIRENRQGITAVAVEEKEGCRDCDWRYWCSGGCPLLTYRMMGRSDVKSPNCSIYKALFPEAVRLEGLRLLKYTQPVVL